MSESNQFSLLAERRFAPFFGTQFFGAFNDNIFRNGLIIVITFQGVKVFGMSAAQLANVAGALFILPFRLGIRGGCSREPSRAAQSRRSARESRL